MLVTSLGGMAAERRKWVASDGEGWATAWARHSDGSVLVAAWSAGENGLGVQYVQGNVEQ